MPGQLYGGIRPSSSSQSWEGKQEHIVLERSARLNLDPKIWRRRRNVLKKKMMFVGGKKEICCLIKRKMEKNLVERKKSTYMIICKMPVHPDNHLQEAGPSGGSFTKGRPIRMIICKRPAHPDDHLQKGSQSRWLFAKAQPIQMITSRATTTMPTRLEGGH